MAENILVIKHGALGDFLLALPAFAAIRAHHPTARITLLTTRYFVAIGMMSPYFDSVWVDPKPKYNPINWLRQAYYFNRAKITRVYDLQTSGRSSFYYRLFWPYKKPEWSGIAPGCSHPDPTPDRAAVHSFDLRVNQLRAAGITNMPPADLGWLTQGNRQAIPGKSILFMPGGSAHRPEKRWPALAYAGLAARLAAQGYTPVVIGDVAEEDAARTIAAAVPQTIDLTRRTTLFDIADLARRAVAAIGNDTGPMHLAAAVGCPSLVLFSAVSDPAHSAPRGRKVRTLRQNDLSTLPERDVETALREIMSDQPGTEIGVAG